MGNLFKLILFHFLLQGINAALTNMEPKNWNDVIFDSQYGDDYCFSYVRPLLNYLKQVKKQIDAHDEMKEKYVKLEKELEHNKMELKYKEDLLNGKDEQIKYLKNVINEKVGKIIEQLNSQNEKTTGNSQYLKDFLNSKSTQITEQLKEQNDVITKNNKQFQDLKDLINLKVKEFGEQIKTKNESEDKQINELKNAINDKIGDLKAQVIANSKLLEEKNQVMMKYNQQEENIPNLFLYDGVHRIKIADQPVFEVSYVSPLSGWIVIQRRMDGSVDFDRGWEDYKKGFGDIRGEFFLGLEKLHLMTQSKLHELYIQMQDVNGISKYAHYDNFKIGSEKENFKLISLGKYNGTAGDSLFNQVGYMFSTKDRDNDIFFYNCAEDRGGWWYGRCGFSHLNGNYQKDGIAMNGYGIAWGSWKNWDYDISLTFTQMMIRPRPLIN